MPDRKYEKSNDRNYTLLDAKQRVIDLMANNQPLPEVGIYDEPVRYFKANEQWCSVIFGWLDWLEDVAGWKDAQNELHAGIQAILIFEEGIEAGGMSFDYDAMREAVCAGVQCAAEGIAAQYLSGVVDNLAGGDIVIGPGATPVVVPPGQAPNDPSTNADEEARTGGVIAIRIALTSMLTDLNTWFGADATADIAVGTAIFRMLGKYKIDDQAALTAGITAYWTWLGTGGNAKLTTWGTGFDSWLYCRGYDSGDIVNYIISNINANYHDFLINVMLGLSDTQIKKWYGTGELLPSSDYVVYSCVPVKSETITLNLSGAGESKNGIIVHKANHRLRIRVSGQGTDAANPGVVIDLFYRKNANGTISRESGIGFVSGAGIGTPSDAKIPYQASGVYDYTMDTTASSVLTFARDNGTLGTGTVGTITIIVDDLGEILL